jgi:hypothetical protein
MLTQEEVRALSGSDSQRGWLEIPGTCPETFRVQICETRKATIEGKRKRSNTANDTAQRRQKVEKLLAEINAQSDADTEAVLRLKAEASLYL